MLASVDSIVASIRDQFLGRQPHNYGSIGNPAIAVSFVADAAYYDYAEDGNTILGYGEAQERRLINFILTGNTYVFMAVINPANDKFVHSIEDIPLDRWRQTSAHDSAWRADGLSSPLSKIQDEMATAVTAHIPEDKRPHFTKLSWFVRPSFSNFITFLVVNHASKDRSLWGGYEHVPTKIRSMTDKEKAILIADGWHAHANALIDALD